ncbi:MAG: ATP-binding cassette domain-containing protein [Anaerolineae bacterium]|nr:ATP-binding cassette domain-containing protein [Anaerolineae bacterium]
MSIVLDRLTKRFGAQTIVDRVSLEVADGEFFVLLGASGSGKSTILRLIAGLTQPDAGRILLQGRDVTHLPPQQRDTGFVFQNYSIFRHMSVADNIEFGLRIRRVPPAERARRREELLDLVDLAGLGARYADQLSGGQRQRVALARALAYEPNVLLLDEPFGALDVKIRAQLRRSLKAIHDRLGVTTILVTHDQEEAFELADRIGVIERGHLLEVGAPEELYTRPRSLFVATFLGAGTVFVGRARGGQAHFGLLALPIPAETPHEDDERVQVLLRPEEVTLTPDRPADDRLVLGQGRVVEQNFTGPLRRLRLRLPQLAATRQLAPPPPFGEEGLLVDAVLPADLPLPSEDLWVGLRRWHILAPPHPRVLVYDTEAGPLTALALARALADRLDASVTLVGVAESADGGEALRAALQRRQEEAGLAQAELRIAFGNVMQQLALEQGQALYDFCLLPASDHPATQPVRLSDTVVNLLSRTMTPTLVVKDKDYPLERILICTAAGEPGKSDVRIGGRLARQVGAAVTLFHVTRGASQPTPLARSHLERAAATLRALNVPTEVRFRPAQTPAAGILAEAREGGYGLVVVGSHGPHSRSVFGLDDVTRQVLSGTDRPVLVVPADEG